MSKIKKNRIKVVGCIIVAVVLVCGGNWLYKNRRVHFEDDMMRQVICLELGKGRNSQDVTYRDLETIEELYIGPVGTFETIEDVAKCKNLKKLRVNMSIGREKASFELFEITETGERYYPPVSEEKMKRLQEDLEEILKSAKSIEDFGFSNVNDTFNIPDMEFLKYGKNIKDINISYANITDYSVLENCSKLKSVDLWYSNIESADDLLKLKNVEKFWLTGTPLAQDQEEIKRLEKAFPEAWIITE